MRIRTTLCIALVTLGIGLARPVNAAFFSGVEPLLQSEGQNYLREELESTSPIDISNLLPYWALLCGFSYLGAVAALRDFQFQPELLKLAALIASDKYQNNLTHYINEDEVEPFKKDLRDLCTQIAVYQDFILDRNDFISKHGIRQTAIYCFNPKRTLRLLFEAFGLQKHDLSDDYLTTFSKSNLLDKEMNAILNYCDGSSRLVNNFDLDTRFKLIEMGEKLSIPVEKYLN